MASFSARLRQCRGPLNRTLVCSARCTVADRSDQTAEERLLSRFALSLLFFFLRSVVNRQTAACTTIPVECCLFTLIYCHSSDIVAEKKKTGLEREGTKPALILTKIRMFMFSLRKRRTGRERCHTVFMFTMRTAIHPDWLTLTHSFGA